MSINLSQARETLVKQPGETLTFDFDFSNLLSSGETLTGTPAVTVQSGSGLSLGTPTIEGRTVKVAVGDGVNGSDYIVQCSVATSLGNVRQMDGRLQVRD